VENTILDILLGSDDQTFCDLLFTMVDTRIDEDAGAIQLLYEPWALERLQLIKQRSPAIFFGAFLGELRRRYRGKVFPNDLFRAMDNTAWENDGTGGLVDPDAFIEAALEYYRTGGKPGLSPGWETVRRYYTVRRGEFTVVTGIASHMKSHFLQAMCVNLANYAGWKIGIFSPEHAPLGELSRCLIECYSGFSIGQMAPEQFKAAAVWVSQHFYPIVIPEEVPPTLAWLLGVARHQKQKYGLDGVVLDPWNEIDHVMGYRQAETQYISQALSKVRRFARHHQVHVWLVAHPTKMKKDVIGAYAGKYPPPTPYDINGSANWYNKADNCLCVWRDVDADSNKVQLHIQKVRYRAVGRPGVLELLYNDRRRFEDV